MDHLMRLRTKRPLGSAFCKDFDEHEPTVRTFPRRS
jgi:hypothetical protein